jgi:hypothetical protein
MSATPTYLIPDAAHDAWLAAMDASEEASDAR